MTFQKSSNLTNSFQSQLGMPGSDLNELAKKSGWTWTILNLIRELKAMMPDELQHMRDLVQRKAEAMDFPSTEFRRSRTPSWAGDGPCQ